MKELLDQFGFDTVDAGPLKVRNEPNRGLQDRRIWCETPLPYGWTLWAFGKQLAYDLVYPRFERAPYKPSGNVPAADFSRVASLLRDIASDSWREVTPMGKRRGEEHRRE